jgi:hypothetical protein
LREKFETADLSELLKRKKRLQMNMSEAVSIKIMPYIGELEEWFGREWGQFNEDLSAGVRNRTNKNAVGSDVSDFIVKTVDIAGRVTNVTSLGLGGVAAIVTGCSLLCKLTLTGPAKIVVWLKGGPIVATLSSVPGISLVACAGVYFVCKFLKNELTDWNRKDVLGKLPELVKEALSPCIEEVGGELTEFCEQRIGDMRGAIFEHISAVEKQEKDILEARKSNDPSIAERMKDELESVHVLEKRFAELKNLVRAETAEYA